MDIDRARERQARCISRRHRWRRCHGRDGEVQPASAKEAARRGLVDVRRPIPLELSQASEATTGAHDTRHEHTVTEVRASQSDDCDNTAVGDLVIHRVMRRIGAIAQRLARERSTHGNPN
jgi:hypothetical protein